MSRPDFWCHDKGGRLVSRPRPLGRDRARLLLRSSARPARVTEHHGVRQYTVCTQPNCYDALCCALFGVTVHGHYSLTLFMDTI